MLKGQQEDRLINPWCLIRNNNSNNAQESLLFQNNNPEDQHRLLAHCKFLDHINFESLLNFIDKERQVDIQKLSLDIKLELKYLELAMDKRITNTPLQLKVDLPQEGTGLARKQSKDNNVTLHENN